MEWVHMTSPSLSKGYVDVSANMNSVMWRSPHHADATCSGASTEEHVLRQEVRARLVAGRSDMPYGSVSQSVGRPGRDDPTRGRERIENLKIF
ncbi:hypothetical protein TNCV_3968461 [Trichonephila clavipes]|nr:hypothetical protein TNCV_3968461 [Trichonephila clavipes]